MQVIPTRSSSVRGVFSHSTTAMIEAKGSAQEIRLALVFFVIHKDIGSLFGVLGWKYILSKKISCGTVNCPEAIKNNRSI